MERFHNSPEKAYYELVANRIGQRPAGTWWLQGGYRMEEQSAEINRHGQY